MRLSRSVDLSSELGVRKPGFDSSPCHCDFFNKIGIMIPALCTLQSCSEHKMGNYATYVKPVYELRMSEPMLNPAILILLSEPCWEVSRQSIYRINSEVNFMKENTLGMTIWTTRTTGWPLYIVVFKTNYIKTQKGKRLLLASHHSLCLHPPHLSNSSTVIKIKFTTNHRDRKPLKSSGVGENVAN